MLRQLQAILSGRDGVRNPLHALDDPGRCANCCVGSTRFNDLRRGVPRMSPALLSKRLKELEAAGVVAARATESGGVYEYTLTEAGEELEPLILALGVWGQRWVESQLSLQQSRSARC